MFSESYLAAAGEGIAIHSPRMSPGAVQSVLYNFRDKFYPWKDLLMAFQGFIWDIKKLVSPRLLRKT